MPIEPLVPLDEDRGNSGVRVEPAPAAQQIDTRGQLRGRGVQPLDDGQLEGDLGHPHVERPAADGSRKSSLAISACSSSKSAEETLHAGTAPRARPGGAWETRGSRAAPPLRPRTPRARSISLRCRDSRRSSMRRRHRWTSSSKSSPVLGEARRAVHDGQGQPRLHLLHLFVLAQGGGGAAGEHGGAEEVRLGKQEVELLVRGLGDHVRVADDLGERADNPLRALERLRGAQADPRLREVVERQGEQGEGAPVAPRLVNLLGGVVCEVREVVGGRLPILEAEPLKREKFRPFFAPPPQSPPASWRLWTGLG